MKFSVAAVLATASTVLAGYGGNITYTTEVVTALTTYCPYATTLVNNGKTYTVTEATTLTITNCPCTISKAVTTYSNSTTSSATKSSSPTTSASSVVTAGAGKAAALSGAGLAGVLGLAALAL